MNKKKIIPLVLSVLVALPTTAFAKGNDNGKAPDKVNNLIESKSAPKSVDSKTGDNNKQQKDDTFFPGMVKPGEDAKKAKGEEHKDAAQQKKDDKKAQIEAFKTEMRAKHTQMKDLQSQINTVKKQVEQKKEQLSAIINDLQSGKKTLPEDTLNQLLAAAQNLKLDVDEVKATAEISTEVNDTQEKVKGQDFNNALASMDKVIAKLQKRLDALKQLSADLDTALKLANLATAPAPTTGTTTTTPTTGTSTTTDTTANSGTTTTTGTTTAGTSQTQTNTTTTTTN